ncbi:hypothetical protein QBC35DRAFT_75769 [Podospora australis]|uniref:N-acetyltransferase domain-containing protein n=1 Tax=Podospora australis TaxID=1536484 RepID=A0AAN6WKX7_9PEZI|nr:hypothetical protein QBC35DRAFT_75769 [Podospora australis]
MLSWRPMTVDDIPGLMLVADEVHPELPESDHVFAERVKLFPEGCLALVDHGDDNDGHDAGGEPKKLYGYVVSHPIRRRQPPALDSLLGGISEDADQYYIHDFAIFPGFRGRGLAVLCLDKLLVIAERFPSACLVSVYGTSPFWGSFGFASPASIEHALQVKVQGYGDDATYLERQTKKSYGGTNVDP